MFISPVTTLLCSPHYHTHTASLACTLQDEDVLHLTLTGLVGGLQHADVDERIDKDISELNKTIEEVQAQFRRISVDVFDHAWFTDRRLLVLRPEWEQLLNVGALLFLPIGRTFSCPSLSEIRQLRVS